MMRSASTLLPDINRLRWILIVFFLAVAIPTAFLVYQSLDQLKWQAVYQYRGVATELAQRIDADLSRRARRESSRPLDDYAFFSRADTGGTGATSYQLRSVLSAYPVVAELPGTIGHFQVDADGTFSTPLLPDKARDQAAIGPAELVLRQALRNRILKILRDNELVEQRAPQREATGTETTPASPGPAAGKAATQQYSNFDRLSRRSASQSIGRDSRSGGLRKLDDLNLAQSPPVRGKRSARKASGAAPAAEADAARETVPAAPRATEHQDIAPPLPPASAPVAPNDNTVSGSASAPGGERSAGPGPGIVTTFENTADPFELSRLNSGHFVLYRRAWSQGKRLIQGMLINADTLLAELVHPGFRSSSIASNSDLTVAFGDSVLSSIGASATNRYASSQDELSGTVLHNAALSEPFNNIRLVFSVRELPVNAGSSLVTWLALLVTSTLAAGLFGLYRLGIRRLELAEQQQDFVAAVSHELKTPLTSIRMYGDMLREGWASEEKKRTYYDYIHDESERLSRLIDNVLQLARMNRNDIEVSTVPMSPAQVLDMVQSRTAASVERAGFTICFANHVDSADNGANKKADAPHAANASPLVAVDPDLFVQVMINLVDNAIKFSAGSDNKRIDIEAQSRDNEIVFSVRDYGPGIQEDQIRKIFDLFYRAETELTRETVGTGIGLALVSELVRAMHGHTAASNAHPGARFEVMLPTQ